MSETLAIVNIIADGFFADNTPQCGEVHFNDGFKKRWYIPKAKKHLIGTKSLVGFLDKMGMDDGEETYRSVKSEKHAVLVEDALAEMRVGIDVEAINMKRDDALFDISESSKMLVKYSRAISDNIHDSPKVRELIKQLKRYCGYIETASKKLEEVA